jgi:hypothetical protein
MTAAERDRVGPFVGQRRSNNPAAAIVCVLAMSGLATQVLAQETGFDKLANLPFAEGRPTKETAQTLRDELLFQRATQTYLWALPLINTLGMQVGSKKAFGAGYSVLPIWKQRLDAKTLVTTPNSDVLYAMSYVDLRKDGPLVMDAPAMLQGILLDYWQRPIPVDGGKFAGDVGLAGPDGGKGGKFLLLPPGYKGPVPEGYFVYRSGTDNAFIFVRGFYEDPKNLTPAVEHLERTKSLSAEQRGRREADAIPRRLRRSGRYAADQRRQRLRPAQAASGPGGR